MSEVLVVDDEPTLVATLKFNLEEAGYGVLTADSGEDAIKLVRESRPDLIILDLMLGEMDGFETCRIIRGETRAPIIMLTARTDEVDKVVGLRMGADDYVTKPFGMKELLARVAACLRRAEDNYHRGGDVLEAGDLAVDLHRREARLRGRLLELKPKELDLLAYFIRNRGRALSREHLLKVVWRYEGPVDTRTVDVHVGRLRHWLQDSPEHPEWIVTLRGTGYRFAA